MHFDKIKNNGSAQLFEDPTLESLTRTHPFVIYSIYLPVIGMLLYFGAAYLGLPVWGEVLGALGGLLFWTLFEYIMHRHLFHMLVHGKRATRMIYTMHGVHHEYPRDSERLFMPPVPSMVIVILLFLGFKALLGSWAFAAFPGFLLGYLAYGSMHYAIHAFKPPKMLKALWRNHHLHHYKTPDKGFGVSSVIWDVVFRTVPKK